MYGQDFFYSRHKVTGNYGKYDKKADDMATNLVHFTSIYLSGKELRTPSSSNPVWFEI